MNTSAVVAPASCAFHVRHASANPFHTECKGALSDMLAIGLASNTVHNREGLQRFVEENLKITLGFDSAVVVLLNPDGTSYSLSGPHNEITSLVGEPPGHPVEDPLLMEIMNADEPVIRNLLTDADVKTAARFFPGVTPPVGTLVGVRLKNHERIPGALFLLVASADCLSIETVQYINHLSVVLGPVVTNIIATETIAQQKAEITILKQQLDLERVYPQLVIHPEQPYREIVGNSAAMRSVYQLVSQVAASQSSVILFGETGTGKELIARAIHNSSTRKHKAMVKVNCATLPANLIESELFGHERGSFTGATERRIGKFELANNGTLFLDEIGELPADLQVKLLRALQEKEIERIGGNTTIKINVRIIAATNRNLQKEVELGRFRRDLYFRLHVFPICLPPLRERSADIPLLAAYFLSRFAKSGTKTPKHFSARVVKQMMAYSWPGNVRELEHLVERSILLATGPVINHIPLPVQGEDHPLLQACYIKTIDEIEREYIVSILQKSNGKIAGIGGAAEMLRIASTTLNSKIKRLGIRKGCMAD